MKFKTYIFIFFISFSGFIFGQEKIVDSLEIKRIDSLVNIIAKDSSLKKIKVKSSKIKKSKNKSKQNITAYLRNKEVVIISSSDKNSSVNFYIDKGKMIYKWYHISEDSRMGSCGSIYGGGKNYYKENKLLASYIHQSNDVCFPIWTQTIGFEEIYEYLKKKIK